MPGPYAAARRRARCVVSGASSHRISGNLMRWCAAEASRCGLTCASGSAGVRERASSFPEWAVGFGALGVVAGPEVGQGDAATQPGQLHRRPRAPTGIGRSGERPPPSLRWPHARFRTWHTRAQACKAARFRMLREIRSRRAVCSSTEPMLAGGHGHPLAADACHRGDQSNRGAFRRRCRRTPAFAMATRRAGARARRAEAGADVPRTSGAPCGTWLVVVGNLRTAGALRVRGDAHASHAAGP